MTIRYYAALVRGDDGLVMMSPGGPLSSYAVAVERHAQELGRQSPSNPVKPPKYERRVLLDLGSLTTTDQAEFARAIHEDPFLRAVFELGRRVGDAGTPCCAGGPQWGHAWDCPKCPD